jgi:hypothetical protein
LHEEVATMPARTIYVREEDEEIWRRAEELARNGPDSLSAIVTAALRLYVLSKEDRYGLVTVRTNQDENGTPTPVRVVQFAGMAVASENRIPGTTVYLTPKGNLVFWTAEHVDGSTAGALRVFRSIQEAQLATDRDGKPLYTPELLSAANSKIRSLQGKTIPNDAGQLRTGIQPAVTRLDL